MQIRWGYLKRVLAGAIFGLYMADLLYFLNPQIDITPGRLVAVTALYGAICGFLFGTALWALRILRVRLLGNPANNEEYRPHGFGFVVFAAFASSLIFWVHLRVFRIYLPLGAIRVLSKATNIITVTAFSLLLLWLVERSAGRRLSRVLFVAGCMLIAVSSVFLYQRRDSYRTNRRNVVVANVGAVAGERPVILVAIRNLPYDWIVTLIGEGTLPFFEQSRDHSYLTRLEPFPTTSPKALWASLATGKLPHRHGVTGRFSYRTPLNGSDPAERFLILPGGVGFQAWGLIPPVHRISAQLPSGDSLPLWAMFQRLFFRSAVIGWPSLGAHDAGVMITDDFLGSLHGRALDGLPAEVLSVLPASARHPNGLLAQKLGVLPAAVRDRIIDASKRDQWAVTLMMSGVMQRHEDLNIVALEGLGDTEAALRISGNVLPERGTNNGTAIRAYAASLDRSLGELSKLFPEHTIVVVSPSGPAPPALPVTPFALAMSILDPDDPGADDGFVLMSNRSIVHTPNPAPAQAVDVVPTILFAAGLPVGRDLDGRVLTDAFSEEMLSHNSLSVIQTYEAEKLIVRRSGP